MCEQAPGVPSPGDVAQELGGKAVKVLWWLLSKAVPALLVAVVWWCSGTPILPRERRYARRVHVAGRLLLTGLAGAALWWGPVAVGIGVGAAAGAVGTAAGVTRAVRASRRRVRVQVGQPVRPAQIRR